jgi:hypothetical protein
VPGTELSNVNIGNKILTEATVLSVTETSVSFRSGRSIVNVPTGQLPTDLRERAYLQVKAALHYKPDPPRASSRPGRPAPRVQDPISSSASNQTPSDDLSSIRRFAYNEAAQYFRYEYQAGTGDSSSRGINISACEEVVGWEGQYRAVGSAQVNQYDGYNAENRRTVGFEIIITRNAGGGLTRSSFTLR